MKTASRLGAVLIGAWLSATAVTACGGEEEFEDDFDLSFNCNESRGDLVTFQMMVAGTASIEPGNLDRGASFVRRLAEERSAPPEVIAHTDAWQQAIQVRYDTLRALPPVISAGRVIEPDTTDMDRQQLQTIQPHFEALKAWVLGECGGEI